MTVSPQGCEMLKNKIVWTVSVLTAAITLSACQPKGDGPKESPDTQTQAASEVQILVLQGETEKVPVRLVECDGNNCPEISIDRLRTNQFVLDGLIDQAIIKNLQETLELFEPEQTLPKDKDTQAASEVVEYKTAAQLLAEQIQPYIDNFVGLDKELKHLGVGHQISLSISPKILNSQGPLATVVLNTSNYLGGAHGSSSQTYFNFDLKQQKQVSLDQILVKDQKNKLNQLAHDEFKKWVIDSQLADNVEEYEEAWKFKLTDNYYLGKKGLILQYGEYEIGPYVVGLPRLTIPYEKLQGVIKPEMLEAVHPADQVAVPQAAGEAK